MPLNHSRSLPLSLLLSGFFVLQGCGGSSRPNDPVVLSEPSIQETLQKTVDTIILPAVSSFDDATNTFAGNAADFCDLPQSDELSALQNQWKATAEAWYRLMPYNFGPLNDDVVFPAYMYIDSLRLRGTDYTATLRNEIADNTNGDHTLDDAYFASQSFQKLGLPALELVLFETLDGSTDNSDILDEFLQKPRKCQVLIGLARQLRGRASYVYEGWNNHYKGGTHSYAGLFITANLEDGTPPITELLTSVQEYLDYLKQRSVATVAAKPSGHIWPLLNASLTEIETLMQGDGSTRFTFFNIMESAKHQSEVETVRDNIAFARDAVSLNNATDFGVAAALLDGNFKREIPDSLDVELGISFSDGD